MEPAILPVLLIIVLIIVWNSLSLIKAPNPEELIQREMKKAQSKTYNTEWKVLKPQEEASGQDHELPSAI